MTEIALEAGFESLEAFSRAFKAWVGHTPLDFRREPDWAAWQKASASVEQLHDADRADLSSVEIVMKEPRWVAALHYEGQLDGLSGALNRFIAWRRATRRPPSVSATYNILHDGNEPVSSDRVTITLCAGTARSITADGDIKPLLLPGGRHARLAVAGGEMKLRAQASWLLRHWLILSGERRRDLPLYVERVRFPPEVQEHEAQALIYLPLEG